MALLNLKDKESVKAVQRALNVVADGIWGPKSQMALLSFQSQHNLVADGLIGPKTMEALGLLDTDLTNRSVEKTFEKFYLSESQYIHPDINVKNEYLFLHHTAGWNNPFDTVKMWDNDTLGRVGVEFVVGGLHPKNGDSSYDGRIVKAFPTGCQAYHLGNTKSKFMNEHSVGIELCNFGYLDRNKRTYTGMKIADDQIVELSDPFRGYTLWHRYSKQQLASLRKLILYIANRDSIDVREGLIQRIKKDPATAFDYDEKIASGKIRGMFSHGNVRADKFDVSPQPDLIDMLMTI